MGTRTHPIFMNFSSGEVSPKVEGRLDLERFLNGCQTLKNFKCLPQGGVESIGGFHFAAETKDSTKKSRLIGLEFSELQNYILELGEESLRFFMDCGQIWTVDTYTKLLLHCDGDDASVEFEDNGDSGHTVTAHGNVKIDTSDKVFGSGSAIFPGEVGDYISVADHADWFKSTGELTLDLRLKFDVPVGTFGMGIAQQYVDTNNYWILYYNHTVTPAESVFVFVVRSGGSNTVIINGTLPGDIVIDEEWHHLVVTRGWGGNANDWAILLDGAQIGSTVTDADPVNDFAADLEIGKYMTGAANSFKGKMDEIRDSKAISRWTAAFDPPTVAYPLGGSGGGAVYELLTSPYQETDLSYIRYDQNEEYLYLVHPDHPPMKLTRTAHDDWKLTLMDFIDGPYEDEINTPTITPSSATLATEKVTNGGFDADSDWTKGANWTIAGGKAVKSAGGSNNLEQDTTEAGAETYRVEYTIYEISGGSLTVSIGGVSGTARSSPGRYVECITATGTGDLTFTPSAAGVACKIDDVSVLLCITLTASAALFQAGHVGCLWRIKHTTAWGYVQIAGFTDTTHVFAVVKSVLDGSGTAAAGHREGIWSDVNGWPRALCFHDGRLVFAGTAEWPKTIWASKTREYEDFTPDTDDDDAYSFTSADLNLIRWIASSRNLSIGALNREAIAINSDNLPLSPTNPPQIQGQTTHGSSALTGILRVGNAILFLQKAGTKIREFAYRYADDAYSAPDLTVLSEHLMTLGLTDLAWQQEPDSIIWALRSDGVLLGCTYDRSHGMVGWYRRETEGTFESIEVIPYQTKDQLWAIVNRTIDGDTKRYVEYLDDDIFVDSGLTYSGSGITSLSGLDHLEGETVAVVGDGAVFPSQVVTSGALPNDLDSAVSEAYVGIAYTPQLITNRPEAQISGTSLGLKRRWNRIIVRVIETMGISINGQVIPARKAGMATDAAPTTVSGDIQVENLGWDTDGRITIEQPLPLKASIVCIAGALVIEDG